MDFIENFSCFSEYALQQDHFSHSQVTIFVILCFRLRSPDEKVINPTFKLPANVTCELHAFMSDDNKHDAGFAQLCMNMILTKKEAVGAMPCQIKLWTDGGPSHFKLYRQLLHMSWLHRRFGCKMWWCFFQSCHVSLHIHWHILTVTLCCRAKGCMMELVPG